MKLILLMGALSISDAHVETAVEFGQMVTMDHCRLIAATMNRQSRGQYWFCLEKTDA